MPTPWWNSCPRGLRRLILRACSLSEDWVKTPWEHLPGEMKAVILAETAKVKEAMARAGAT